MNSVVDWIREQVRLDSSGPDATAWPAEIDDILDRAEDRVKLWDSDRTILLSGQVSVYQCDIDPGDIGEPRLVESDGVTHLAVPSYEYWGSESAAQLQRDLDALEEAWGVIANAGGGNWKTESADWQVAAARWRDTYMTGITSRLSERLDV